jgi:uncharacterized protein YndB with AHSA1/START domain
VIKKVFLGLAAALILLAAFVALQPASYTVTRSAVVNAPPERVFPLVNDFHAWEQWSPWAKIDPEMSVAYYGAEAGQGAVYAWSGNDDAGEGRMTILESQTPSLIRIRLEFLRPFQSVNATEFSFRPEGDRTEVQWTMRGDNGFMEKAVFLAMGGIDKAVGPDFEKGLAQMKAVAEAAGR